MGRLDKKFGKDAFYVHLLRSMDGVAARYGKRYGSGIIRGYARGIIMGSHPRREALELARDYYKTVNANIDVFKG